jgi:hypothetical protein
MAAGATIPLTALRSFLKAQMPPLETTLIQPTDDIPLKLAEKAQILIPLPGFRGVSGVESVHKWRVDNNIKYQAGAEHGGGNRCVYGVDGRTGYAVQMEAREYRKGPIQLDCTTYSNLMLSVYLYGTAHNAAYDGDCAKVGGVSSFHCARDRYGFQIVGRPEKDKSGKDVTVTDFRTAEQIATATAQKGPGLYALEPALIGSGAVKHLALLYASDVYECTNASTPQLHQASARRVHGPVPTQRQVLLPVRAEVKRVSGGGSWLAEEPDLA